MRAQWFIPAFLCLSCVLTTGCMSAWKNEPGSRSQRLGFKQPDQQQEDRSDTAGNGQNPNAASDSSDSARSHRSEYARDGVGDQTSDEAEFLPNRSSQADNDQATGETKHRRLGSANSSQSNSYDSEPDKVTPPEQLADRTPASKQAEQEAALADVIAELEAIGELDAETRRQLIADLRETKPALWQPMISIYRLALSSRKRAAAREQEAPPAQTVVADAQSPSEEAPSQSALSAAAQKLYLERLTKAAKGVPGGDLSLQPANQPPATLRMRQPEALEYDADAIQEHANMGGYVSDTSGSEAEEEMPGELEPPRRLRHPRNRLREVSLTPAVAPPREVVRTAAKPNKYAVRTATAEEQEVADWQAYLEESILLLEEDLPESARTVEEVRQQAELRLLYLAGGDREAALRPIDGISTTQQEFWSETIFALATYLDAESLPDGPRRAAEARRHLEAAVLKLGELSTLSVRNIAFCSKVNSYGIYETYPKDEFAPGQQVLLYTELENFKCENTPTGFVTSVRSSYQIFDSRGVRVESHDFATTEESCRNRRRDFFMRYFIDLPTRIYDGEYTLKLTIEDLKGQTSGEAIIPFTIKEKQ